MSVAAAKVDRLMSGERWERAVPVYGFPLVNGFFLSLLALVVMTPMGGVSGRRST